MERWEEVVLAHRMADTHIGVQILVRFVKGKYTVLGGVSI